MKQKITKVVAAATLVAALLLPLAAGAQTTVVATGGSVAGERHSLSYSVGQVAVMGSATSAYTLREGVQQPLSVEDVSVGEAEAPDGLTVYPNPTSMFITIRLKGDAKPAEVRLYSLDGRLLHSGQWDGTPEMHLDLSAYAAGVYMLQVNNKTYKITKQ